MLNIVSVLVFNKSLIYCNCHFEIWRSMWPFYQSCSEREYIKGHSILKMVWTILFPTCPLPWYYILNPIILIALNFSNSLLPMTLNFVSDFVLSVQQDPNPPILTFLHPLVPLTFNFFLPAPIFYMTSCLSPSFPYYF